jgi:DNA repair protein RecN (Recombination protein N)
MQIAITHLPQIAAKGNVHFKVFKTYNYWRGYTIRVKSSMEERVVEIAHFRNSHI